MILIRIIITKINPKEDDVMQWHTQAGNVTINFKIEMCFTPPELSVANIVKWNSAVDESANSR